MRAKRRQDSLPIIFAIAVMAILVIGFISIHVFAGNAYTVTFNGNDGNWDNASETYEVLYPYDSEGQSISITAPDSVPNYPGYTLSGWYNDPGCTEMFDFSTDTISSDSVLYAGWEEVIPATTPIITNESSYSYSLEYGDSLDLKVTVEDINDHSISYQWRSCTSEPDDSSSWSDISGATSYTYSIDTSSLGTSYYYCVVTSTRTDNNETASTNSYYTTVTVSKRKVTVSGITAENRVYDEDNINADLDFSNVIISNVLEEDTDYLTVEGTGTFADDAMGLNKTVTISDLTLTGTSSANYTLDTTNSQTTTTASITGGTVTPTLTLDPTKTYTYNGYSITPDYTVKLSGETFPATNYNVTLTNNINAGTATITIEESDSSLYDFEDLTANFTIGKATLSAANVTVGSMTYNGSSQNASVTVRFGTSTHELSYYTITGTTSGTSAGSYTLTVAAKETNPNVTGSITKTYSISKKPVTVSGITASDKTYDGTTNATVNYSNASITGKVSGDSLTVSAANGAFISKNAGSNVEVTISGITLEGTSLANYTLDETGSQNKTNATISKLSMTPIVSISPSTYKYTGSAITPTYTVKYNGSTLDTSEYTVSVSDNNAPGTGNLTVTCTGTGNYLFDPVTKEFTISQMTTHTSKPSTKLTASTTATTLSDVPLGVTGWEWEDPSTALPTATTKAQTLKATAVYTAADASYYKDSANTMTITVTIPKSSTTTTKTSTSAKSSSSAKSSTTLSKTTTSSKTSTSGKTTSSSGTSGKTTSSSGSTGSRTTSGSGSSSLRTSSSLGLGSGSSNTEAQPPFIEGAPDISGWDAIELRLSGTAEGDSLPVYMNGTNQLPSELLNSLKGKNITLVLDMGNSIKWNINGMCIPSDINSDIDFSLLTNTNGVPAELVNMISSTDYNMQLSLGHDGDYGCAPILTLNLGTNNAGLYANLFYFNTASNSLEYETADQISEDGTASLAFTHASDYVIVVDKEILANVSVHLDMPEEDTATADADTGSNEVATSITDPDGVQAYVQKQEIAENNVPRSQAVARRIVAPEVKAGVKIFWISLFIIALLLGLLTFLLMNRRDLKAYASARKSKKALAKTTNKVAVSNTRKNKGSKKYTKYL
ncbi:MAG: InlB B-repeat-containing protein [Lachnospiraceae bacterium]|nr:InlB B-repeat-containing protein [Lachnospiraceae bacterium]